MRRVSGALILALSTVLGVSVGSHAQDPSPAIDLAVLEALCDANTPDEPSLANCLAVTHKYLVPVSGPTPGPLGEPGPIDVAALDALCETNTPDQGELANCLAVIHAYLDQPLALALPSLGFTYDDPNLSVTLLGVEWSGAGAPADRQQVSLFVRYYARADADFSARDDWDVKNQGGDGGGFVESAKEPAVTGGALTAGQAVEGWVTFEFPMGVTSIDVTYADGIFGDDHPWHVAYDPAAGPVVQATAMPTAKPTPGPTKKPGLGFTHVDPNLKVTLRRVEWDTRSTFLKPDAGKQWISIFVRYAAREAADFNATFDWKVVDADGFEGEHLLFTPKDPELTDGSIRKGSQVEGWITFEFPKGVRSVEVIYSDGLNADEHSWVVRRR